MGFIADIFSPDIDIDIPPPPEIEIPEPPAPPKPTAASTQKVLKPPKGLLKQQATAAQQGTSALRVPIFGLNIPKL